MVDQINDQRLVPKPQLQVHVLVPAAGEAQVHLIPTVLSRATGTTNIELRASQRRSSATTHGRSAAAAAALLAVDVHVAAERLPVGEAPLAEDALVVLLRPPCRGLLRRARLLEATCLHWTLFEAACVCTV